MIMSNMDFNSTLSTLNSTLSAKNSPNYTNGYIAAGVLGPFLFLACMNMYGVFKDVSPSRFY
jgi:hypothetical protein